MGRPCKQVEEGGAALGVGGKLAHVGGDAKQGHGDGPVPKQALKPLGGRKARVVGVEGEGIALTTTFLPSLRAAITTRIAAFSRSRPALT